MSDRDRGAVLTGGCQCGAVRYALYTAPEGTHLCHCRMCQKAVGGPFAALTAVALLDFAWTRGQPTIFASSSLAERGFCSACGTPLTFRYTAKDNINVTLGSLDRPQATPPEQHYGIESRVPWLESISDLPASSTGDHMPKGLLDKCVDYQHPDNDTADDWSPPGRA